MHNMDWGKSWGTIIFHPTSSHYVCNFKKKNFNYLIAEWRTAKSIELRHKFSTWARKKNKTIDKVNNRWKYWMRTNMKSSDFEHWIALIRIDLLWTQTKPTILSAQALNMALNLYAIRLHVARMLRSLTLLSLALMIVFIIHLLLYSRINWLTYTHRHASMCVQYSTANDSISVVELWENKPQSAIPSKPIHVLTYTHTYRWDCFSIAKFKFQIFQICTLIWKIEHGLMKFQFANQSIEFFILFHSPKINRLSNRSAILAAPCTKWHCSSMQNLSNIFFHEIFELRI